MKKGMLNFWNSILVARARHFEKTPKWKQVLGVALVGLMVFACSLTYANASQGFDIVWTKNLAGQDVANIKMDSGTTLLTYLSILITSTAIIVGIEDKIPAGTRSISLLLRKVGLLLLLLAVYAVLYFTFIAIHVFAKIALQ